MSLLAIERQSSTATAGVRKWSPLRLSFSRAACEVKRRLVAEGALPKLPNMPRYKTGCGVGMEALASPITLQAIKPPLTIISGLAPKKAGFHKTKSASLPGSMEPTWALMPWVMAGLMVYLATYRLMRRLSLRLESSGNGPRWTFIL